MTPSLSEAIARVEARDIREWSHQEVDALRTLIDAAKQADAWREVALAARGRCESAIHKVADITEQGRAPKGAEAMRVAAGLVAALPAPESKGA